MTVRAILSAKGGDVISIDPTATLETAVKTLAKHRIGALLVLGPDRRVI
jgi:CBS domain-containing protein